MVPPGFLKWALTIVLVALVLALIVAATVIMASAVLQPPVTPTIRLEPGVVKPGDIVVVRGKGWPALANMVIVIALSPKANLAGEGLVPVGAAPVSLDGTLAATFVYPAEVPWTALSEAWVVARPSTGNLQAVAHLVVQQVRPTPTATPALATTPLVGRQQIQGTIVSLALDQSLVIIRPFDSSPDRGISLRAATIKFLDGRTAARTDLRLGLAVAATGWPESGGSLLAEQITILEVPGAQAQSPVVLLASPAPTATPRPVVQPTCLPTPVPTDAWLASYYPNPWFMGPPVLVREDWVIDFNWRRGPPAPGLPSYGYSVRWVGNWTFPRTCRYRFLLLLKGEARLSVDGRVLINAWDSPPAAEYPAEIDLTQGLHALQVDYRNMGSEGLVQLRWEYVAATIQ